MAILERPASRADDRPKPTERRRPTPAGKLRPSESRATQLAEKGPIVALSILVCLCVGYGIGTLAQFDRDWRDAPTLVATAEGSAEAGTSLVAAVEEVLADSAVAISDVVCEPTALVGGVPDGQMCRGRLDADMVSIVATGTADTVHVEVFSTV